MGKQLQYHVAYIAASHMPEGHDWLYLPGEERSMLLMRVGADERRVFDEVADMLTIGHAGCVRWVA